MLVKLYQVSINFVDILLCLEWLYKKLRQGILQNTSWTPPDEEEEKAAPLEAFEELIPE